MSIAARMASYQLLRLPINSTLDAYGIMSTTPTKVTDIQVSITKNQPTHDNTNPSYDLTPFIGITDYVGVQLGDTLKDAANRQYQVKDIGNRGSKYQALFLIKL